MATSTSSARVRVSIYRVRRDVYRLRVEMPRPPKGRREQHTRRVHCTAEDVAVHAEAWRARWQREIDQLPLPSVMFNAAPQRATHEAVEAWRKILRHAAQTLRALQAQARL